MNTCTQCGATFAAATAQRKYCSPECRKEGSRRKRGEREAPRTAKQVKRESEGVMQSRYLAIARRQMANQKNADCS